MSEIANKAMRTHRSALDLDGLADDLHKLEMQFRYIAFDLDRNAAEQLEDSDIEPERSVLYRSAANLAIRCRLSEIAKKLIEKGLAGNPPEPYKVALEELGGQVEQAMEGYQ